MLVEDNVDSEIINDFKCQLDDLEKAKLNLEKIKKLTAHNPIKVDKEISKLESKIENKQEELKQNIAKDILLEVFDDIALYTKEKIEEVAYLDEEEFPIESLEKVLIDYIAEGL